MKNLLIVVLSLASISFGTQTFAAETTVDCGDGMVVIGLTPKGNSKTVMAVMHQRDAQVLTEHPSKVKVSPVEGKALSTGQSLSALRVIHPNGKQGIALTSPNNAKLFHSVKGVEANEWEAESVDAGVSASEYAAE